MAAQDQPAAPPSNSPNAPKKGNTIAFLVCDSGTRYFSTTLFA